MSLKPRNKNFWLQQQNPGLPDLRKAAYCSGSNQSIALPLALPTVGTSQGVAEARKKGMLCQLPRGQSCPSRHLGDAEAVCSWVMVALLLADALNGWKEAVRHLEEGWERCTMAPVGEHRRITGLKCAGDLAIQGKVCFICVFFVFTIFFKYPCILLQNRNSGHAWGDQHVSVVRLVASNHPPVLAENH